MSTLVDGANAFAVDLYARLGREAGNLFLSPYSIHLALTLACAGARGRTAEEMAGALHLPLEGERLHDAVARLRERLFAPREEDVPGAFVLALAHAIWGQRGYPFSPEYMALARVRYGAGLHEVDFLGAPAATRQAINAWVEAATAGKIKDLVGPGMLAAETRLALTSAIYFKGAWAHPFDEDATADAPFHLRPGTEVAVPMMRQTATLGYLETDGFQAVTLPYGGGECSMAIFVPRAVDGLAALERQCTAPNVGRWTETMDHGREVHLWLPRFSLSSRFMLSPVLASLGLSNAFSPEADFTGIVEAADGPLWLGEVIHGARIELDEEGTEAAASTAWAMLGIGAEPVRRERIVVKADRPFLYVIRHTSTGAILFMGRLADPR